jgi:putative transposase
VVLDLFSRQVVGWSMQAMMHSDLVLQALLAAMWRRKPAAGLMLHSDQDTQYPVVNGNLSSKAISTCAA